MTSTDKATRREDLDLLISTLEMLATPFLACQHRDCRRSRRCIYLNGPDLRITCHANLDTEQKQLFVDLFWEAHSMLDGKRSPIPSTDPHLLEREQAAIEIVEATFPKPRPRMQAYRHWKKRYDEEVERRNAYFARYLAEAEAEDQGTSE